MKAKEAKEEVKEVKGLKVILSQILILGQGGLGEVHPAINEFAQLPLRASIAFKMRKIFRQVTEQIEDFNEIRREVLLKFGKLDENGKFNFTDNDSAMKFQLEIQELLKNEVVIEGEKIGLFDLGDAQVSTAVLFNLEWLIAD